MKISGNEIKPGMIISHKGSLWRTIKTQHTKPGKGGAYLQAELKSLNNSSKLNERFRSSESVEKVSMEQQQVNYLYKEDSYYVFMDQISYEQILVDTVLVDVEQQPFLIENLELILSSYDDKPVYIELPKSVELEVVNTETTVKGQTASASFKPAYLSNGVRVMVPPHIQVGMKLIISTEDTSYIGKAK